MVNFFRDSFDCLNLQLTDNYTQGITRLFKVKRFGEFYSIKQVIRAWGNSQLLIANFVCLEGSSQKY